MHSLFTRLLALSLVFVLALSAQRGHAQATSMSLGGSVQSDENKPLPGAAITVIHLPSGVRRAASSDGTGHFVIPNLLVGGPYLMQVGEGGYRPQTLESIFLENGKTANFTVTLNKLASPPMKGRAGRTAEKAAPVEALAQESVVGGPVLIATGTKAASSRTRHQSSAQNPAPMPLAPASAAPVASSATAQPATPRYYRYPARRSATKVGDPIVPGRYDVKSGNYIYDTGLPTTLKLAGGGVIPGVGTNSTEGLLYRFLTNPEVQVDTLDLTRGWYNFDRVYFNPGKATLTTESLSQLRNVATLLQAYPKARVKLGGYTDSTGTYKVNKLLSEARARTAWASLVEMGVSPSRIEARGYGPRYGIAPNTTDEGRAKNRRLSVKVLQK